MDVLVSNGIVRVTVMLVGMGGMMIGIRRLRTVVVGGVRRRPEARCGVLVVRGVSGPLVAWSLAMTRMSMLRGAFAMVRVGCVVGAIWCRTGM